MNYNFQVYNYRFGFFVLYYYILYHDNNVIVLCIMGIIRVGVFIYHEIIYSASLFNKLNGLGFASSFNLLKQLGFIDYFMINKQLLASDYSYIIPWFRLLHPFVLLICHCCIIPDKQCWLLHVALHPEAPKLTLYTGTIRVNIGYNKLSNQTINLSN